MSARRLGDAAVESRSPGFRGLPDAAARPRLHPRIGQSRSQARHERSGPEDAPAPTDAMLALGTATSNWVARLIVLTFLAVVVGLGIELGVAETIPHP